MWHSAKGTDRRPAFQIQCWRQLAVWLQAGGCPFCFSQLTFQLRMRRPAPLPGGNDYKAQMKCDWHKVLLSHYVSGSSRGHLAWWVRREHSGIRLMASPRAGNFPPRLGNLIQWTDGSQKAGLGSGRRLRRFHWGTSTELVLSGPMHFLHASEPPGRVGDIIHLASNLSWIRCISCSPDS